MHALTVKRQETQMNKSTRYTPRKKALTLLVICASLVALLVTGCSGGKSSGASSEDQKAMLAAVGKFYAAQGALDLAGMKASLYDPQDISGIATATVPPGAKKAEVVVKPVADTVVISIPSQELTLTASVATASVNAVKLSDPNGQTITLIMKKDGSAWKIDVAETQKASAAAAGGAAGQSAP
jgi:hypothetical protein